MRVRSTAATSTNGAPLAGGASIAQAECVRVTAAAKAMAEKLLRFMLVSDRVVGMEVKSATREEWRPVV